MSSFSKNKERQHMASVIPTLNNWWSPSGEQKFVKVPASGALRWKNNKHWIYSDLVPPEDFPFCVECKFHAEIDLDEVLRKDPRDGKITWFWYWQTIQDSIRATNDLGHPVYPMLVYKVNRGPNHLVLQSDLFERLPGCLVEGFSYLTVCIPQATPFVICLLDNFLGAVKKPDFEKYILGR